MFTYYLFLLFIKNNTQLHLYLHNLLGGDAGAFLNSPVEPSAIRVNTLKTNVDAFKKFLGRLKQSYRSIPFTETGLIIENDELPLSHTLAFFKGHFQYQGISSQLPVVLLNVRPGQRVLDMTAAPGSKSTQLAAIMKNKGELILNDFSSSRLQALNVNMQRSGATNFYILNLRGERLGLMYPEYFDKILLDAPCTALGTLAASREVASWWNASKMIKLTRVQYHLLVSAIKALKVDGELVYSTCSITPEENEMLIQKILAEYPVQIVTMPQSMQSLFSQGLTKYENQVFDRSMKKAIRIWPHLHQMEGFFSVKLKKFDSMEKGVRKLNSDFTNTRKHDDQQVHDILMNITQLWGISDEVWPDYRYILTKTRIWMLSDVIEKILNKSFISGGILLAEKRLSGWKLTNASIQILSKYITKRRLYLPQADLRKLFAEGKIRYTQSPGGYYALENENEIIAALYIDGNEMRTRLPHAFNLIL
jgi:NOL1/NOP2/sun family putative RNA methylase